MNGDQKGRGENDIRLKKGGTQNYKSKVMQREREKKTNTSRRIKKI